MCISTGEVRFQVCIYRDLRLISVRSYRLLIFSTDMNQTSELHEKPLASTSTSLYPNINFRFRFRIFFRYRNHGKKFCFERNETKFFKTYFLSGKRCERMDSRNNYFETNFSVKSFSK